MIAIVGNLGEEMIMTAVGTPCRIHQQEQATASGLPDRAQIAANLFFVFRHKCPRNPPR